jgi:hypothetical protein
MKTKGIYTVGEPFGYELIIEYDYEWNEEDRFAPPEDDLYVTNVTLDGMDITVFFMDFLESSMVSELYEYAQENKHN